MTAKKRLDMVWIGREPVHRRIYSKTKDPYIMFRGRKCAIDKRFGVWRVTNS